MQRNFLLKIIILSLCFLLPMFCFASSKKINKLIDDYYSVYHTAPFNLDKFMSFYADDVVFVDPTFQLNLKGKEAVRKMMSEAVNVGEEKGHSAVKWSIHRRIIEGNHAVIEGTWTGNYAKKPYSVRFVTYLTFRGNKISNHLDFFDANTWIQQVGLREPKKNLPVTKNIPLELTGKKKMGRAAVEKLIDSFYTAYQKQPFDVEQFVAHYTDDFVLIDPTFRLDVTGKQAIREIAIQSFPDYKEIKWTINRRVIEGNTVAIEGTVSAILRGKPFSMRVTTIFGLRDGKIASQFDIVDFTTFAKAVGLKGYGFPEKTSQD